MVNITLVLGEDGCGKTTLIRQIVEEKIWKGQLNHVLFCSSNNIEATALKQQFQSNCTVLTSSTNLLDFMNTLHQSVAQLEAGRLNCKRISLTAVFERVGPLNTGPWVWFMDNAKLKNVTVIVSDTAVCNLFSRDYFYSGNKEEKLQEALGQILEVYTTETSLKDNKLQELGIIVDKPTKSNEDSTSVGRFVHFKRKQNSKFTQKRTVQTTTDFHQTPELGLFDLLDEF